MAPALRAGERRINERWFGRITNVDRQHFIPVDGSGSMIIRYIDSLYPTEETDLTDRRGWLRISELNDTQAIIELRRFIDPFISQSWGQLGSPRQIGACFPSRWMLGSLSGTVTPGRPQGQCARFGLQSTRSKIEKSYSKILKAPARLSTLPNTSGALNAE